MKRVCIIGWPVEHSRSPIIHTYWLKQHGIDGEYVKEAVRQEEISSFLKNLSENGYVGANVTIPHKQSALAAASDVDEAARAIGAANTLWIENNQLFAANTDAYGFMTYLKSEAPSWNDLERHVVVLGAGGAARAIVYGLLEDGAREIILCNRTTTRAEELAQHFGSNVKVENWENRSDVLADAGLLVNTTELGMDGSDPLEIDLRKLPFTAIVADIVYTPLETDVMLNAQALGLKTVDGLGMLLYQAVPGFEKWFGVRPEVTDELREMIIDDLEA